ncbi:MAG: hypothetical protein IT514_08650 [Burkholderiales bacterium]|nr:hypothetical protein [Burkholderiales bacterium]
MGSILRQRARRDERHRAFERAGLHRGVESLRQRDARLHPALRQAALPADNQRGYAQPRAGRRHRTQPHPFAALGTALDAVAALIRAAPRSPDCAAREALERSHRLLAHWQRHRVLANERMIRLLIDARARHHSQPPAARRLAGR